MSELVFSLHLFVGSCLIYINIVVTIVVTLIFCHGYGFTMNIFIAIDIAVLHFKFISTG